MTAPTGAALAQLQTQLAEAKAALHKLLIGRRSVEVVTQGDVVKFTPARMQDLRDYIAELEAQIAGTPTSGAVGFTFAL